MRFVRLLKKKVKLKNGKRKLLIKIYLQFVNTVKFNRSYLPFWHQVSKQLEKINQNASAYINSLTKVIKLIANHSYQDKYRRFDLKKKQQQQQI